MKKTLLYLAYYAIWIGGLPFNFVGIACTKVILYLSNLLRRLQYAIQDV